MDSTSIDFQNDRASTIGALRWRCIVSSRKGLRLAAAWWWRVPLWASVINLVFILTLRNDLLSSYSRSVQVADTYPTYGCKDVHRWVASLSHQAFRLDKMI